jgi:hypothetical protein
VAALVFAMRYILMDGIAAAVALGLGFLIFRRLKPGFYEHI